MFIQNSLVFLASAVVCVPLAKKVGLGSILGYLIAGSIIGPYGFGLITDVQSILQFAELGVVLLLFLIGLELKPSRLWVMRRSIFGLGTAQVIATTLLMGLAAWILGFGFGPSVLIGFALSLSSTAFALQTLGENKQLNTEYGRTSFAILLFQDLAVIPALALIPLLAPVEGLQAPEPVKSAIAIVAVILGGRLLLRPIFRVVAQTHAQEVFTATALLVVFAVGGLMHSIGLSMALGAFLAGLLLADSEYRHELETDIEPFKGLLLGLFFIAVGMSVNYDLFLSRPFYHLNATLIYITLKILALFCIGKLNRYSNETSRNLSVALSQGSEFAFVLLGFAVSGKVLDKETADTLIVVVTLSMAANPLIYNFNERFLKKALGVPKKPFDEIDEKANPVIIAGFGRFGQIVGRILRVAQIPFTALELDPEQVEVLRKFGNKIYYGDASRLDLLKSAGAQVAKLMILAIDDVESSIKTAEMVRDHFPHLKIFARARNRNHAFRLLDLGVTVIERETFWSSVSLARKTLLDLGVAPDQVAVMLKKFSDHDEQLLSEQHKLYKNEKELINYSKQAAQQLTELLKKDL